MRKEKKRDQKLNIYKQLNKICVQPLLLLINIYTKVHTLATEYMLFYISY